MSRRFGVKTLSDHLRNTGVYERIILKQIFQETGWETMKCIRVADARNKWRALVNTITNLRVP
jgi:hypothetical protein